MADVHKQEFFIKNLATRSVTLFPERASIVRDIENVNLQPGANEIVIHGLTPTADEHSIKVDGRGAATITDMTIDLVPNPDSFWEEHPSDSEDDFSDSDADIDRDDFKSEAVKRLDLTLRPLKLKMAAELENVRSANARQSVLDSFGNSMGGEKAVSDELDKYLQIYQGHSGSLYKVNREADNAMFYLEKEITRQEKERAKAVKIEEKKYLKAVAKQEKERERKRKIKEKEREKRLRLREEKQAYWPKKCYRVTLYLDVNPNDASDQSFTVIEKSQSKEVVADSLSVNLSLSYNTQAASWSPRYDLTLLTPSRSGSIVYRAEFKNTTSETWRDAKVVLSTSQTSFQGLNDTAPGMQAWHVGLSRYIGGHHNTKSSLSRSSNPSKDAIGGGGLQSNHELAQKQSNAQQSQKPIVRIDLFGVEQEAKKRSKSRKESAWGSQAPPQAPQAFGQASSFGAPAAQAGGLFGSSNALFASAPAPGAPPPPAPSARSRGGAGFSLFRRSEPAAAVASLDEAPSFHRDADSEDEDGVAFDAETIAERNDGALVFQEGVKEEFGLTTTYDVPGVRTLEPSKLARRHVIASIELRGVELSYTIVPKLRAAAFLKAKVKNLSAITLLKGQAGLTLDGSFLGNAVVPRCSPDESFSLGLGVDPAIHVSYAKPTMKLSTTGFLSKEDIVVYSRNILISNTKPQAAHVDLLVLDQIPVSEDERLRIAIREPRGLRSEGDSAKTGTSGASDKNSTGTETNAAPATISRTASIRSSIIPENAPVGGILSGNGGDKWGSAVSTLKKDGEVSWNVKLNKGQSCRLKLEYEAKVPSGEIISGLN